MHRGNGETAVEPNPEEDPVAFRKVKKNRFNAIKSFFSNLISKHEDEKSKDSKKKVFLLLLKIDYI